MEESFLTMLVKAELPLQLFVNKRCSMKYAHLYKGMQFHGVWKYITSFYLGTAENQLHSPGVWWRTLHNWKLLTLYLDCNCASDSVRISDNFSGILEDTRLFPGLWKGSSRCFTINLIAQNKEGCAVTSQSADRKLKRAPVGTRDEEYLHGLNAFQLRAMHNWVRSLCL